jgi:hypothetical protein
MINPNNFFDGPDNGKTPRESADTEQNEFKTSWVYPSSARPTPGGASSDSPTPTRKRRVRHYADYRELVALESEARKLNISRVHLGARSSTYSPQSPEADERAPSSGENNKEFVEMPAMARSPGLFNPQQPIVLIVDQRMNMLFGSGRDAKSVVAVNIAALIAWQMLAWQKSLGAIVFNDKKTIQFRPGCNRLHTLLVLQALVNQNHSLSPDAGLTSNPGMLNDALRQVSKLAANPSIFLITDTGGSDPETFRLLNDLSQNGDVAIVLVYDSSQAKFSGATRGSQSSNPYFPVGVPVLRINTRSDWMHLVRRLLTRSVFRSAASHRWQQASQTPPPAQSL